MSFYIDGIGLRVYQIAADPLEASDSTRADAYSGNSAYRGCREAEVQGPRGRRLCGKRGARSRGVGGGQSLYLVQTLDRSYYTVLLDHPHRPQPVPYHQRSSAEGVQRARSFGNVDVRCYRRELSGICSQFVVPDV